MNRRGFLQVSAAAGGGLLLGIELLGCGGKTPPGGGTDDGTGTGKPDVASGATTKEGAVAPGTGNGELNAWIQIGTDDIVRIKVHMSEMGQGVLTSFAQVLADELHAD